MSNLSPRHTPTTYAEAHDILDNARDHSRVPLCYATELTNGTGDGPTIVHHRTAIVTYLPDGSVRLDGGGWASRTTADRMHRFTPHGVRVNNRRGRLGVEIDGVGDIGDAAYGLDISAEQIAAIVTA